MRSFPFGYYFFFFNDTATTEIYTLSLHDALPISNRMIAKLASDAAKPRGLMEVRGLARSEEHTSELQSLRHLVCRLLLEKKNNEPRQRSGCNAGGLPEGTSSQITA